MNGLDIDKLLPQLLSTNGDGTGTTNAIGDYSSGGLGATAFFIAPPIVATPPSTNIPYYEVCSLAIRMTTDGDMTPEGYGKATALTNGVVITVEDDDTGVLQILTLTDIKKNSDYKTFFVVSSDLVGRELNGEVQLYIKFFAPLRLRGESEKKLVVTLNDDMSTRVLTQHFIAYVQNWA